MTCAHCNNAPACPWVNTAHGMHAHGIQARCPKCLRKYTLLAPENVRQGRGPGARRLLCATCTVALLRGAGGAVELHTWERPVSAPIFGVLASAPEVPDVERQGCPEHKAD